VKTAVDAPLLPTYARQDVTFVRGEGASLVDDAGRRYLDLLAGLAVVGLGHCHPAPLAAASAQLAELWHASNLYWTEPMAALAARLSERVGGAQAFFCNSGTEAIEAALKWARKATGRPGLVALEGSFHGRTFGSLSITGQPAKRGAFEPLVPGSSFVAADDEAALADAVGPDTAAIVLEPIQGEGGVHPLSPGFVATARQLADDHGALLVLDEVQTGVGRTGTFLACEGLGVRPDAVCLAKGLANGLPIGALLVLDEAPTAFEPGDHGSTFGGNPVACAAACAVLDELTDQLLASVRDKGAAVARALAPLPGVVAVRGRGLLLGVELDRPAADVVSACLDRGVIVGSAGDRVVRLTPPLTIADAELDHGLAVLDEVLT
jgi:acetylornithine/N-succinyldiaminopimelate aminotransferase